MSTKPHFKIKREEAPNTRRNTRTHLSGGPLSLAALAVSAAFFRLLLLLGLGHLVHVRQHILQLVLTCGRHAFA